jgi:hypothetical protein
VGRARRTGCAGGPWAWRGRWRVTLGGASEGAALKGLLNFLSAKHLPYAVQHAVVMTLAALVLLRIFQRRLERFGTSEALRATVLPPGSRVS